MIGLVIYLIGFLATYGLTKWIRVKSGDNEWEDVLTSVFWSIFSWFGFIFVFFALVYNYIKEERKDPPKWL